MSLIEGLLIFFAIIAIYAFSAFALHKKGVLKKYNITFWGPALMWRTNKGKKFIKKVAQKKRFWKAFGSSGVVLCFVAMIVMTSVLIWQVWMFFGFELTPAQKEALPGPEIALPLPGINPILPLEYVWYILLAFVVAIIVHEFSHGILTFASKLKVKSLGLLYLIIPIGAFCEPDEEQLKKAKAANRMRIYAAGPTSNFVVVLLSVLLFSFVFMSAVQPVDGVDISYVGENTPAEEIGLSCGMVITSINDIKIMGTYDFFYVLKNTSAGQTVNISFVKQEITYHRKVTLADKYNYTNNESYLGKGYLGVGPNPYEGYISALKNPFTYHFPDGFILLYALPILGYFWGYNPIASPFTDSYVITGPLSTLPTNIFWIIVNALYWIFWLNFAVAIFNVLPMVPLDGGFLFNDALSTFIKRVKKGISDEQRERIVRNISIILSLTILFLILFPFIMKYIP